MTIKTHIKLLILFSALLLMTACSSDPNHGPGALPSSEDNIAEVQPGLEDPTLTPTPGPAERQTFYLLDDVQYDINIEFETADMVQIGEFVSEFDGNAGVGTTHDPDNNLVTLNIKNPHVGSLYSLWLQTSADYVETNYDFVFIDNTDVLMNVSGNVVIQNSLGGTIVVEITTSNADFESIEKPGQCYLYSDSKLKAIKLESSFSDSGFKNEYHCEVPADMPPGTYSLIVTTEFEEAALSTSVIEIVNGSQLICAPTETQCAGKCVDLLTNKQNCGYCGNVCTGGKSCNMGVCE